ncbi:molybdate ABC transporter substrate-binding protein [Aliiglaciecola sp. 3_MG-2023]|uniref:molybdate ABC transporter substrate-binding protein n=1 Tax=Aliiglaciecola sp. 3_MG-2023 TaxID=3062644 RepID=UPI0026E30CE6|nr:molybdate ABC transporter substrate-binding protein [Aliiglaciecola sp. 3_MG-2023]MDO6693605.1 molybdate ABC transporter substrate-binding protein [Aliiglaciecola sp. 3_MG-2023]
MKRPTQKVRYKLLKVLCGIIALFYLHNAAADQSLHVAVASNFLSTFKHLKSEFEQTHNSQILISTGSTGKLFAQISHGAPYDIFLSADDVRPKQLQRLGLTKQNKPFTYAYGKLVVFHPGILSSQFSLGYLTNKGVEHIAIANPKLAPYGEAAKQWLVHKGVWTSITHKVVMGENINQALQYVKSGNAQVAIVALSMVQQERDSRFTELDSKDYQPIKQQGVLLTHRQAGAEFITFLSSEAARTIIQQRGYGVP